MVVGLIGAAHAGIVGHAAVSTGMFTLPLVTALEPAGPLNVARLEVGGGTPTVQVYVMGATAFYRGEDYQTQAASGAKAVVVGHGSLTSGALGARRRFDLGRIGVAPHLDLGVAFWDSPMDPEAYEDEVVPQFGVEPTAGLHSVGPWLSGGADLGVELVDDTVAFTVSPEAAFVGIHGMWVTVGTRVGFTAAL